MRPATIKVDITKGGDYALRDYKIKSMLANLQKLGNCLTQLSSYCKAITKTTGKIKALGIATAKNRDRWEMVLDRNMREKVGCGFGE